MPVRRHAGVHFVHLELGDLAFPLHRVVAVQEGVWVCGLAVHRTRGIPRVDGVVRVCAEHGGRFPEVEFFVIVGEFVHEFGTGVVLSLLVEGAEGDDQEEGQG